MADCARATSDDDTTEQDSRRTPARGRRRFTVDSLFSDTRAQAVGVRDLTGARIIELSRIVPDPSQPRRTFDPDRLDELANSIRAEGILQPIVVRFDDDRDRYVIVHGERRFRAATIAGLAEIPAIVRDVPAGRLLVHQLMENIVRDDLNTVDRAAAIRALRGQLGDPPWEDVAAAVGIRRSRLFQLLGTEKLTPEARADIREGRLSEKQSRALQGLTGAKQEAMRALIVSETLPAATATRLARAFRDVPVHPGDDFAAATLVLRGLRALVDPPDRAQRDQQSLHLLEAIRKAAHGTGAEQQRLKNLASLAAAPRFTDERFSKDMSAISKSLAGLASRPTGDTTEAAAALRALRDAIDAIVSG